ncbi:MAG: hypothetical protein H6Q63_1233 [Firmicutes bacterium]|nr:hypothetical protein [Bacillota bacterium]
MIGKELIGRESESVILKVRQEDVRRFAEAAGIPYDDRAPTTYVGTLIKANIEGLEWIIPHVLLNEQKIVYPISGALVFSSTSTLITPEKGVGDEKSA